MFEYPVFPFAERIKIEQIVVKRPATGFRAGTILVIIRIVRHHRQPDRVDIAEEGEHLPGFGDKGLKHRMVHLAVVERQEIGQGFGGTVLFTLRRHLLVIG